VDEPARLKTYIPTAGWEPIDTHVRISDVASLVRRLGGEQLYGYRSKAPLRELIQNASDAVRARALLEAPSAAQGIIKVKLSNFDGDYWLEIADSGIGMSTKVLIHGLLDFRRNILGLSDSE
jgi:hypothetical protein